jgi:hypothetical protein
MHSVKVQLKIAEDGTKPRAPQIPFFFDAHRQMLATLGWDITWIVYGASSAK